MPGEKYSFVAVNSVHQRHGTGGYTKCHSDAFRTWIPGRSSSDWRNSFGLSTLATRAAPPLRAAGQALHPTLDRPGILYSADPGACRCLDVTGFPNRWIQKLQRPAEECLSRSGPQICQVSGAAEVFFSARQRRSQVVQGALRYTLLASILALATSALADRIDLGDIAVGGGWNWLSPGRPRSDRLHGCAGAPNAIRRHRLGGSPLRAYRRRQWHGAIAVRRWSLSPRRPHTDHVRRHNLRVPRDFPDRSGTPCAMPKPSCTRRPIVLHPSNCG